MKNSENTTKEQQRLAYEDKEWEACCKLDEAEGYAISLCDQLEDIIEVFYPDEDFQLMPQDKLNLVASAVFNHRKALSALSDGVLYAIKEAHEKLD